MENKEYIIGIDIGSSNVVMAAGVRNDSGEISVRGVEIQEVEGCVKNGDIVNYIELGNVIAKAKSALEQDLGVRINSSYVSLSGKSVYCVRYEDYVEVNNQTSCVTENELRELHSRIETVVSGVGDEIIDRMPLRYCIDDRQEVKNPLGTFGRKLSATYLFVLVSRQQIDMVNRAMYRAEIKVSGLCVSPTLLPQLLLNDTEREEGTVIVDIGSDITDISVVQNQKLWYFSSLPIGASSINNDLREFLRIPAKDIDQLKRKYASALAANVPDNVTVPVKTASNTKKQILQRNIAEIVEERLKDIAGFVARELKAAKFSNKVPGGVVLTGGSAYLANIEELFARELGMEVRLGRMLNGLDDESQQQVSAFPQSVAIGLLLYGAQHNACETMPEMPHLVAAKAKNATNNQTPNIATSVPLDFTSVEPVATPEVEVVPESVVVESVAEKTVTTEIEEQPQEVTPSVENLEPQTEKVEQTAVEKQPEEQPEVTQPRRPKWQERFRSFAERFRNKVDDMFTDELI